MLTQLLNGNFDLTTAYFWVVGLLIAITFHEAAHAFVADRLGDFTPRYMGRLTINPLAHLDPLGTALILLVGFGWGKPVIFNPLSLKNPALGAALISLAGPVTNFILAAIFSQLVRFQIDPVNLWYQIAFINVLLGIFNLIPVSPLDGEKVVGGLLPENLRGEWASLQRYGIFLLLAAILFLGPFLFNVTTRILGLMSGVSF